MVSKPILSEAEKEAFVFIINENRSILADGEHCPIHVNGGSSSYEILEAAIKEQKIETVKDVRRFEYPQEYQEKRETLRKILSW